MKDDQREKTPIQVSHFLFTCTGAGDANFGARIL
jgi:hypothetical protein